MTGSEKRDGHVLYEATTLPLDMPMRWHPCGADGDGPVIVVTQGDLTACALDAIVNPANSHLSHGGGVAGAIARKGGRAINDESRAWIKEHKSLPVGHAMSTSAGKLPCRFVIHTVGPMVGGDGSKLPTLEQAQQLRDAVWNALCEADRLQVASVAMPGISSGIFGYPRDLAAKEILGECARFARERVNKTTVKEMMLLNIDLPTCKSFVQALREEIEKSASEKEPEDDDLRPYAQEEETVAQGLEELDERQTKRAAFDVLAISLAPSIVAVCARHKMSIQSVHRTACSGIFGEVGALSMELVRKQRPDEKLATLEVLQGKHRRHVPFYSSQSCQS